MIPFLSRKTKPTEAPAAAVEIRALLDPAQKRVACAQIQAAYKGDPSVCHLFDEWVTEPTPDLVRARGTMEQWRQLAKQWSAA